MMPAAAETPPAHRPRITYRPKAVAPAPATALVPIVPIPEPEEELKGVLGGLLNILKTTDDPDMLANGVLLMQQVTQAGGRNAYSHVVRDNLTRKVAADRAALAEGRYSNGAVTMLAGMVNTPNFGVAPRAFNSDPNKPVKPQINHAFVAEAFHRQLETVFGELMTEAPQPTKWSRRTPELTPAQRARNAVRTKISEIRALERQDPPLAVDDPRRFGAVQAFYHHVQAGSWDGLTTERLAALELGVVESFVAEHKLSHGGGAKCQACLVRRARESDERVAVQDCGAASKIQQALAAAINDRAA